MIIGLTDLHQVLEDSLSRLSSLPSTSDYAFFKTLFDFGFRIEELKSIHTWSINAQNEVVCKTSKGSADRLHHIDLFHPIAQQSVLDGVNYLYRRSYSSYNRVLARNLEGSEFRVLGKGVGSHLFRHHRIKQLSADGMSIDDIKSFTGITNNATVNSYINSNIQQFKF